MKKLLSLIALALCVVMVLAACTNGGGSTSTGQTSTGGGSSAADTSSAVNTDPLVFAYIAPMTGDQAMYGEQMRRGLQMRCDELNAAGGVNGRMVEFTVGDDKGDPKESVNLTNLALEQKDLIAVFGPFASTNGMAMSPLLQKAGVIHMGVTCSHADFTKGGDYVFRGCVTQAQQTLDYAAFAKNDMDTETCYLIVVNNDWGINIQGIFTAEYERLGGKIVGADVFIENQTKDFTPLISKAKDSGADMIYVCAMYNDSSQCIMQIGNMEVDAKVLVGDSSVNQEFITLVGAAGEGTYAMGNFSFQDPNQRFVDFRAKYKSQYTDNDVDSWVINAYDAMGAVCKAIEEVGTNPADVRDWLANMKDFPGVTGPYSYDAERNPAKPAYKLQVIDGNWVLIS